MKPIFYKLQIIILIIFTYNLYAENYYVSKSGNNNNDGKNISKAFKTITKAVSVMNSGDVCYISEGKYREVISLNKSNLTFKNYNKGSVLVTGTDRLTNWVSYKNGIYEVPFSGAETSYSFLFADGKRQEIARWPNNTTGKMLNVLESENSGYANCNVFNEVNREERRVTIEGIKNFPRNFFKSGIFRGINGAKWINPMGVINSSNGNLLKVAPITNGWKDNSEKIYRNNGAGHGFIFHLNALDAEGEWFHQNGKVYYKPQSGKNPNNQVIEILKRKYVLKLRNNSGNIFEGIRFKGGSIELKNSSGNTFKNCSVKYMVPFFTRSNYAVSYGEFLGIHIKGSNNVFENCYVGHTWGNGFSIEFGNNNRIDNCIIEDIGWIAQFTASVQNKGRNTIITNSTLGSTGRFHVRTDDKVKITYNDLYDCMKMGQDAGSIQSTNGGQTFPFNLRKSEIAYNKIHDITTLFAGSKQFVLAFYLEGAYNYSVHHNLIYNIITDKKPDGTFVYLGPRRVSIQDCYYYNNTIWNVDKGVGIWNRDKQGNVSKIMFWNNIIDSKAQDSQLGGVTKNDLLNKIDFSNNLRTIGESTQNNLFQNVNSSNFKLRNNNQAINNGVQKNINGIMLPENFNGIKPDIGAIEFGDDFPRVGATISENDFNNIDGGLSNGVITDPLSNFSIFPIPAKSNQNLTIQGDFDESTYTVNMRSATGELVLRKNVSKLNNQLKITLPNLTPGMYIVIVKNINLLIHSETILVE